MLNRSAFATQRICFISLLFLFLAPLAQKTSYAGPDKQQTRQQAQLFRDLERHSLRYKYYFETLKAVVDISSQADLDVHLNHFFSILFRDAKEIEALTRFPILQKRIQSVLSDEIFPFLKTFSTPSQTIILSAIFESYLRYPSSISIDSFLDYARNEYPSSNAKIKRLIRKIFIEIIVRNLESGQTGFQKFKLFAEEGLSSPKRLSNEIRTILKRMRKRKDTNWDLFDEIKKFDTTLGEEKICLLNLI